MCTQAAEWKLDPALLDLVAAPDDGAAEAVLSRLLEREAQPLARRIAARKLRSGGGGGSFREDVEDITAEALLALTRRLRALREDQANPIESLANYTATVTFNAFVHHLRRRHGGRAHGLRAYSQPAAGDADGLAALPDLRAVPADVALDRRRRAERVWAEVTALPVRQRLALLLNLRDASGAGMLWVLPILGLATLRQIAHLLDLGEGEMAELWSRLPLEDLAIAERLGCTRQQVINLRSAARKRLGTRLGDLEGFRRRRVPGERRPPGDVARRQGPMKLIRRDSNSSQ